MADRGSEGLQDEIKEELLGRLRRAEGQLRGIQKMIAEGRGCREILTQLAAVKAAVVQAAMTILGARLARCVQEDASSGRDGREAMEEFMEIFKKFS